MHDGVHHSKEGERGKGGGMVRREVGGCERLAAPLTLSVADAWRSEVAKLRPKLSLG